MQTPLNLFCSDVFKKQVNCSYYKELVIKIFYVRRTKVTRFILSIRIGNKPSQTDASG